MTVTGVENSINVNVNHSDQYATRYTNSDPNTDTNTNAGGSGSGSNTSSIICKLLYDNNYEEWKSCVSYACQYGLRDTIQCHFRLVDIIPSMMKVCFSDELSIHTNIIHTLYPLAMSHNRGHVCVALLQYFYSNYTISKSNPRARAILTVPALIQSDTPRHAYNVIMKYMCERHSTTTATGTHTHIHGSNSNSNPKYTSNNSKLISRNRVHSHNKSTSTTSSTSSKMIVITEKSGMKRIVMMKK